MLSGMLKPFVISYIANIDLVLIGAVVAFLDMLINRPVFTKRVFNVFLILIIFTSYILLSISYSNSINYAYSKLIAFCLNILFFLYPLSIRKFNVNLFIRFYAIIVIPLTVFFIQMKSILWSGTGNSVNEVFMELRSNYLAVAYHLGILTIFLNYFKKNIYLQLFCIGLLFATSARGPFLFTLLVLMIINIKSLKSLIVRPPKSVKYILLTLWIPLLALYYYWDRVSRLFETSINRFSNIDTGNDESLNTRFNMYEYAITQPFDKIHTLIFGNGFGSFGINYYGQDMRAYPHNAILEVFYELGVVGVLLFGAILLYVFYYAYKKQSVFSFLLVFGILNALKSYSIADSWVLFGIFGSILVGLTEHTQKHKRNET